jgi:hypothetical protein
MAAASSRAQAPKAPATISRSYPRRGTPGRGGICGPAHDP